MQRASYFEQGQVEKFYWKWVVNKLRAAQGEWADSPKEVILSRSKEKEKWPEHWAEGCYNFPAMNLHADVGNHSNALAFWKILILGGTILVPALGNLLLYNFHFIIDKIL